MLLEEEQNHEETRQYEDAQNIVALESAECADIVVPLLYTFLVLCRGLPVRRVEWPHRGALIPIGAHRLQLFAGKEFLHLLLTVASIGASSDVP